MTRKSKGKPILIFFVSLLLVAVIGGLVGYTRYLSAIKPASGINSQLVFTVEEDMTGNDVIKKLYDQKLIQSEFFTKVYVKLNHCDALYAGNFLLNRNMSVAQIFDVLNSESNAIIEQVEFMIVPGDWAKDVARSIASVTNLTAAKILEKWNDINYIDSLIEKYDFLSEEILASEHCYLEGYLTPETYYVYKATTVEEVTERILEQTEKVYQENKAALEKTDFTYHQLITLASVIQFEASTVEDMGLVSGVFYNRFNEGMRMESSVTVCYALYDDFHTWEDCERHPDIDSRYNTYMYEGLPVGPVCNPNRDAINAALNPTASNYFFFVSNVNTGQMYYAETYEQHERNVEKYMR